MSKFYTGVGSRETPPDIMELMKKIGQALAGGGWCLRSGAADGADYAFEFGWYTWFVEQTPWPDEANAELYIPWNGFNGHDRDGLFGGVLLMDGKLESQAAEIASKIHPAWERLSQGAKKLHTRNIFQVLGQDLATPSKFLICYAVPDKHGVPKGGTRTAWVCAQENGVQCFNLYQVEDKRRIEEWILSR